MSRPIDRILEGLPDAKRRGNRYVARCPAHHGEHPDSLSLTEADNGNALVYCFGGCDTEAVLRALGLEFKDLFIDDAQHLNGQRPARPRAVTKAADLEHRHTEHAAGYVTDLLIRPEPGEEPDEHCGCWIGVAEMLYDQSKRDPLGVPGMWATIGPEVPELLKAVQRLLDEQRGAPGATIQRESTPKPRYIRNARRQLISCQHNALLWLEAQQFIPAIGLDTFRQSISVAGELLSEEVIIELVRQIEAGTMIHWAGEHVRNAVISLAMRNQHSSLTTWLDSLVWDQTARLDRFFIDICDTEETDYARACARVMFISAVARAYRPGCQADIMVVLIGGQGIGKSKNLLALMPDETWFTDDLGGDLQDRRAAEGLQGKWLVEFSEFARINRATIDVVKSFLSRRVDRYRPAYGRMAKDFPRQCVFVGTTNNYQPLQDLENRRFLPLRCPKPFIDLQPTYRDQLWAEAVQRYRQGEPWWIQDAALIEQSRAAQDDARLVDAWEDVLREQLLGKLRTTMLEVAGYVGIKADRLEKPTQIRLGLALQSLGFERKREKAGTRLYYYERVSC